MPRPKDDSKLEAIHAAAAKLVLQTGFAGLTMAAVAKEAGVATGTLYIYYKAKDALIEGAFLATKASVAAALSKVPFADAASAYPKVFKTLWNAYYHWCEQHPDKMLFLEQALYSGYVSAQTIAATEASFQPLQDFMCFGIKAGHVLPLAPELLKAHVTGAIHEVIRYTIRDGKRPSAADTTRLREASWAGIRA